MLLFSFFHALHNTQLRFCLMFFVDQFDYLINPFVGKTSKLDTLVWETSGRHC